MRKTLLIIQREYITRVRKIIYHFYAARAFVFFTD